MHVELGHPFEFMIHATTKALGVLVISTYKLSEVCTLGKAKQQAISKMVVPCLKIFEERLFFNISSPQLPLLAVRSTCYSL